jgi:pyruvate/2-oxoglutarate dehydrogenase complex dihydrolipoamide dehydrogenase (E3) component
MMLMIGDPCVRVEPALMEPSRERSTVVAHLQSGGCVRADRLLLATGRRPNADAWRGTGSRRPKAPG